MPSPSDLRGRAALVFGASGITGWAVLREALQHSSQVAFSHIIGLTNRPMDRSRLILPEDDRLTLASGINLSASVDEVADRLSSINGIEGVTDVYFAAYVQPPGTSEFEGQDILKEINVRILETAVLAVEKVSPQLRFWSLQTGGKSYGFTYVRELGLPKTPCSESDPRIPQPYEDQVFYYAQHDALERLSAGKSWRFTEIRPDLVIGFVPGGMNAMNLAQGLGLFLSIYADREPPTVAGRKSIVFPGTVASYNARHTEIGQQTLGRAHIFVSDLTAAQNGEVYNVGDSPSATGLSWRDKWPAICEYFGLAGLEPSENEPTLSVSGYMSQRRSEWEHFERKHGLLPGVIRNTSWEFLEALLSLASFDRQYDLSKFAAAGFQERVDVLQNYVETFNLMRKAKIIP